MGSSSDKRNQAERLNVFDLEVKAIDVASTIKGQNVKLFLNTINNLKFTQNTEIQFTSQGIKFICEESQSFQGAYVHSNSKYHY